MSDKSVLSDEKLRMMWAQYAGYPGGVFDFACAVAEAAIAADRAARAEPVAVNQFRKAHCADWYDGLPDNEDGRGPYEERTLYTALPSAPVIPQCFMTAESGNGGYRLVMKFQSLVDLHKAHDAMLAAAPAPSQEPKP